MSSPFVELMLIDLAWMRSNPGICVVCRTREIVFTDDPVCDVCDDVEKREMEREHWDSGFCECDNMSRSSCPVHGVRPKWLDEHLEGDA